ncbi:hypothetical protein G153_08858 [Megasphaera sp. BL7]|nr:hypothetical protein G153_08858 [Megasphaera sp. BL7]
MSPKLCYAKNSLNGYLLMRRAKKPFVLNMESVVLQETSGLRGIVKILLVKNFHENLTTVPIAHPLKWKHWSSRHEKKIMTRVP